MLKIVQILTSKKLFIRRYSTVTPVQPYMPPTKMSILQNGIRVATEESSSKIACVSLFVQAGPRFETATNHGMTHFIEHLAYKGFTSKKKQDLENKISGLGASFTALTTRDTQVFSAVCLSDTVADIIEILSKIVTDLELSETEIENEKANICLEQLEMDNDPTVVLFDYLHQTAFQGTTLARSVLGPSANLQSFSSDGIRNFICSQYQPFRLTLAASGEFSHGLIMDRVNASLGNLVQGSCEPQLCPCRFTGSQIIFRDDSLPYAHIAIAFEVPGYDGPDFYDLYVASCMIGSWNRSQGGGINNGWHLSRAASVEDICESFQSFYIAYKDVGLWGIYFVCKKMDIDDFLYNVNDTLMNLCITTVPVDVFKGINWAKLKMAKKVDGCKKSCYDIGLQMMYSCKRRTLAEMYENVSHVTANSIKAVADKYFYDRCLAVAAVGPTEALPEYNRLRASTYWLRL